ncbi:MAG: ABC transporter ATP-binding protein [Atribacterota bacterium]
MTWLFEMQEIYFSYPTGTVALEGLSLRIPSRKKVVFLGANGSGKTTLFLHLVGILRPQKGRIVFRGEPITYTRSFLRELRQKVGIVFQDPDAQLFAGTVFQEVSFGPMNLSLSEEEVQRRVKKALALLHIEQLQDRPIHFLSYGEKRRVAIADVLAMDAEVILFDEPNAYLDEQGKTSLLEIIEGLYRSGKEILLATHDVDFAYALADWVVVLEKGKVLREGPPEEVFAAIPFSGQSSWRRPLLFEIATVLREWGYLHGTLPRRVEEFLAALQKSE